MPSKQRKNRTLPYVLISNQCNRRWFGFTLQKNHLFGEDAIGKFVVCGMDEKFIHVYRANYVCDKAIENAQNPGKKKCSRDEWVWTRTRMPRTCKTAQLILQTHAETGKKPVEYKSTEKLARELYNPRNTVWDSGFVKMPNMRIPGGAW